MVTFYEEDMLPFIARCLNTIRGDGAGGQKLILTLPTLSYKDRRQLSALGGGGGGTGGINAHIR
jgi:hypothetical protein